MVKKLRIAPSTHPVKIKSQVIEYAKALQEAGADFIHCDVMDGNFVSEITYDASFVKQINSNCIVPIEAHLMIVHPEEHVKEYIKAGANIITVHYESFGKKSEVIECLENIKKLGALAGISFKPQTLVSEIYDFLPLCNLVLVMSVEPGKSGQLFIPSSLSKIKSLNTFREQNNFKFLIEVDGGVNPENTEEIKSCGADIVVSGSYLFLSSNPKESIDSLR
ncbi:MAG: ribulose-phosphate 3-epimerase [Clostridia bacterium]